MNNAAAVAERSCRRDSRPVACQKSWSKTWTLSTEWLSASRLDTQWTIWEHRRFWYHRRQIVSRHWQPNIPVPWPTDWKSEVLTARWPSHSSGMYAALRVDGVHSVNVERPLETLVTHAIMSSKTQTYRGVVRSGTIFSTHRHIGSILFDCCLSSNRQIAAMTSAAATDNRWPLAVGGHRLKRRGVQLCMSTVTSRRALCLAGS